MDPISAIATITSVSGLFGKLYKLGENLIDAKKDFDKFQTWCWLYNVQIALIRKWADEHSEAFEKIGKIDTRRLFNKVLKNITRILASLEKLLSEVPGKSEGEFKRRVRVVSIAPDALKTIETLDGLMSQVQTTMVLLESTNKFIREPAKADGDPSQSFDPGLWSSLEVTPTKDLDVFVAHFFDHLNTKVLNADGERAIHIASRMGNLPILDSLLRHGVRTDVIDVHKSTPLHLALRAQPRNAVDKLLDHSHTSLFILDEGGFSPLHLALEFELEDISTKLIDISPSILSVAIKDGMLPLHVAAERCLPAVVHKILQYSGNTNVNQRTNSGHTALALTLCPLLKDRKSSEEKQRESIKLLLQHGADVTQNTFEIGRDSLPVLHYLASGGQTDLLKEVQVSWEGIVNMEYERRPDAPDSPTIHGQNFLGATPLYFAALHHHLATVKFLLGKGANPNIGLSAGHSSYYQPTPLWVAVNTSWVEMAKELLSGGASPNAIWHKDNMLHNSIESPCAQCRTDLVKLLLSHNADLHLKGKTGRIPLVHAARKGCIASLSALWDAYTTLENFKTHAVAALYGACTEGHHSCVVFLLARGVDINAKTKYGYTPLHYAARFGRDDVINILLPMGADRTIVASTRYKPFQAAGTAEAVARASGHDKTGDLIKDWGCTKLRT